MATLPSFAAYTTNYLQNLLVTNPGVTTFAMSLNGAAILTGNAGAAFQDVQRYQIINELANRQANDVHTGATYKNIIYDNAPVIGSLAGSAVLAGHPGPTFPANFPNIGPNPSQSISQVA